MEEVVALFEFMSESSWIQELWSYGMEVDPSDPESIGKVLLELYESTWSDNLYTFHRDIVEAGFKFRSIRDMRNIYLVSLLSSIVDEDVGLKIAELV